MDTNSEMDAIILSQKMTLNTKHGVGNGEEEKSTGNTCKNASFKD
jgi:hypothetical protein